MSTTNIMQQPNRPVLRPRTRANSTSTTSTTSTITANVPLKSTTTKTNITANQLPMKVFDENIPQNLKSGASLAVNGRRVVTAKRSALGEITNKTTTTANGQVAVKKTTATAINVANPSVTAVPPQNSASSLPSAQVNLLSAAQAAQSKQIQAADVSNVRRVPLVSAANNAKKQAMPALIKMETTAPFVAIQQDKQQSLKPAVDAFTIYQDLEDDDIEDDEFSQSDTSQEDSSLIEDEEEVVLENIEPMDIEQVQILGRSQVKDAMMSQIPSFPSAALVYSGFPKAPQFDMMLDQDDIIDIDAGDLDDPQFCTEYVGHIFQYLRDKELKDRVNPNYMDRQVDITRKHRTILVDWLSEVCTRFKLLTETMFICVNIVDRFLQYKSVSKQKLQLVGVTALLIACKFEEIYTPEVEDFIYITDQAYSRDDVLKMERLILMTLDFNLSTPTPLHFLRRFSRAAQSNSKIHTLSKYLAELSLLEAKMLNFLPSMVAAASVYISRKMTQQCPVWTPTLQYYSGYSAADILPCVQELNALLKKQPASAYKAISVKYSSQQLLSVALIPPVD